MILVMVREGGGESGSEGKEKVKQKRKSCDGD